MACSLANFDFKRAGVFLPATLRETMFQFGESGECGVALALTILGVGLPVESGVGLRAVALGEFVECFGGAIVAIFVECFAAAFIKFLRAVAFFLLAVALFLLTITFLLLAVPLFLFAIALFLIAFGCLVWLLKIMGFPGKELDDDR